MNISPSYTALLSLAKERKTQIQARTQGFRSKPLSPQVFIFGLSGKVLLVLIAWLTLRKCALVLRPLRCLEMGMLALMLVEQLRVIALRVMSSIDFLPYSPCKISP